MYRAIGAEIEIEWSCEFCGETGIISYTGDEMVDNSFAILDFNCPNCGAELEKEN